MKPNIEVKHSMTKKEFKDKTLEELEAQVAEHYRKQEEDALKRIAESEKEQD